MEPWISAIANGGGLVLLAFVLWQGAKFGGSIARAAIDEWRKSNDAQIGVLREIRDSMHRADVERVQAVADVRHSIESSAKEVRHSIRNDLQVLAGNLAGLPPDEDSEPPPPPKRAQKKD